VPKFAKVNKQYGGPGVFIPDGSPVHIQQGSGSSSDSHRRDSFPSSILPSNSSMGLDLYKPEYEHTVRARPQYGASTEQLVNDMGELTVLDSRRRDTFPVSVCCSSAFPALGSPSGPANAFRLLNAICIDFRALCHAVLVLASLSHLGKLGPRNDL
jgi:hypothetical protein